MTIASLLTQTAGAATNGATVSFSFSFRVQAFGAVTAAQQIEVVLVLNATGVETVLTLTSDYTVSVNADQDASPGGSITTVQTYASGYTLYIRRAPSFLQSTDLTPQGPYSAAVIERTLDQLEMQILDLRDQASKSPHFGVQAGTAFDGKIRGALVEGQSPILNGALNGWEMGAPTGANAASDWLAALASSGVAPLAPETYGASVTFSAATNSTAFAALEAAFAGALVDLRGRTYAVTSKPVGAQYVNGFFSIVGADNIAISYPAHNTISGSWGAIWPNGRYQICSQDTAHVYNDVYRLLSSEGSSHQADDQRVIEYCSHDGVHIFRDVLFADDDTTPTAVVVNSAGTMHGQQFVDKREHDSSYTITAHRLMSRRLGERKELTGDKITTTNASSTVTITWTKHGFRTGQTCVIAGAPTVNSIALSGWYKVTRTGKNTFTVDAGSNASASGSGLSSDAFSVESNERPFESTDEILIGGVSLGAAILANVDVTYSQIPGMIHSFATDEDENIWMGISGGGNIAFIRINDPLGSSPTLKVVQISATTLRIEPNLRYYNGALYGFARTQSLTARPFFWYCDNPTAASPTCTVNLAPSTDFNGWTITNTIPFDIVDNEAGTPWVYAFPAQRLPANDVTGNTQAPVSIYCMAAPLSTFRSGWTTAIAIIKIGEGYYGNAVTNDASNGEGIGTAKAFRGRMRYFTGVEQPDAFRPNTASPQIVGVDIPLKPGGGLGRDGGYIIGSSAAPAHLRPSAPASWTVQNLLLPETQRIVRAFYREPVWKEQQLMDSFVYQMKRDGLWDLLDGFYEFKTMHQQQATINWKYPFRHTLTVSAGVTFTPNSRGGFVGNGSSGYINTGMRASELRKFAQNSCHVGAWVTAGTDAAAAKYSIGMSTSSVCSIAPRASGDNIAAKLGSTTNSVIGGGAVSTIIGHTIVSRHGASDIEGYKAGASVGNDTDASTSLNLGDIWLLRDGSAYSDFTLSCFHIGSDLTDALAARMYANVNELQTGLAAL